MSTVVNDSILKTPTGVETTVSPSPAPNSSVGVSVPVTVAASPVPVVDSTVGVPNPVATTSVSEQVPSGAVQVHTSTPVGTISTPVVSVALPPGIPKMPDISAGQNSLNPVAAVEPTQSVVPAPVQVANIPTTSKSSKSQGTGSKSRSKSSKRKQPSVTMATAQTASSAGSSGGENTGRWTAEEHRLFLQGLDQHGKGWKKIASLIKSRTVVQIRTHAQKYFQKLAKARQNGEEGDVTMEGRGGIMGGTTGHGPTTQKKKRQLSGTKRKSISRVVASVTKEAKTMAAVQQQQKQIPVNAEVKNDANAVAVPPAPTLPSVAPALAPFVVSPTGSTGNPATLTPTVLEDSLYRFLTPVTGENVFPATSGQGSDGKASAVTPQTSEPQSVVGGATSIKLPVDNGVSAPIFSGETSPTSIMDISFPTFDPKEPPQWFAKGAGVADLLDEADTLDWLADSGDLEETYNLSSKSGTACSAPMPIPISVTPAPVSADMPTVSPAPAPESVGADGSPSVAGVTEELQVPDGSCVPTAECPPQVTANLSLPSLFDAAQEQPPNKRTKLSTENLCPPSADGPATVEEVDSLPLVTSTGSINDALAVFDTALDEQAFVSALLDTSEGSAPVLAPLS